MTPRLDRGFLFLKFAGIQMIPVLRLSNPYAALSERRAHKSPDGDVQVAPRD